MIPIRAKVPSERPPVVAVSLVVLNGAAFLFELALAPPELERLFFLFGLVPARYAHPHAAAQAGLTLAPWPFLTGMFLHGGWMHLIANMWSLWLFGDKVEDRMGHARFFVFYLLCGLGASLAHLVLCRDSVVPVIGASGAIAGVMGAYFIMYPFSRIVAVVPIFVFLHVMELPAFVYLGFWFLSQFFSGAMSLAGAANCVGGIAFWTHVGGFVTGVAVLRRFVRGRIFRRG